MPSCDGFEIRRPDIVPIREFCAAREGNSVGATAAKGLRVEVRKDRYEVEGDDCGGFRIRVRGPLKARSVARWAPSSGRPGASDGKPESLNRGRYIRRTVTVCSAPSTSVTADPR